jgi:hypothetical protein
MNRRTVWALGLLLIASVMFGQAGKTSKTGTESVEQALIELENRWDAADVKSDVSTIGEILAADWTGITADGTTSNRSDYLDTMKKMKVVSEDSKGFKVRVLSANAAVLTATLHATGTDAKGQKFDRTELYTDVYSTSEKSVYCRSSSLHQLQPQSIFLKIGGEYGRA